MHPRESIMETLKTMFEGIVSISPAIPAGANATTPIDLIVETSGAFTGTALKTYRVDITTPGISGVAKCTITDITDGTDSVLLPVTITSGTLISLGVKGAKIKFTFTDALVLNDSWQVKCNIYHNTVKKVYRVSMAGLAIESFPAIILAPADQEYNGGEGGLYNNSFTVEVEAWIQERASIDTELNEILEDVENCLKADPFLGGKAFDSRFARTSVFTLTEESPFAAVSIGLSISYKQVL